MILFDPLAGSLDLLKYTPVSDVLGIPQIPASAGDSPQLTRQLDVQSQEYRTSAENMNDSGLVVSFYA